MARSAMLRLKLPPDLLRLILLLIVQVPVFALLAPGTVADASAPSSVERSPRAARADPMTSWFRESATYRICSSAEPETERAIEQFIAGRAFMTVLVGRPDGCADLTIVVFPHLSASGRQTTSVSFSSGSGPSIRVRITAEPGRTQVTIGAAG